MERLMVEMKACHKITAEMRASQEKVDAWIEEMKAWRNETTAFQEELEACLN
jgi:hypothetical protein